MILYVIKFAFHNSNFKDSTLSEKYFMIIKLMVRV
jgi:hypothetical protein